MDETIVKWKEVDFYPALKSISFQSFADHCYWMLSNLSDFEQEHIASLAWMVYNRRNDIIHRDFLKNDRYLLDRVSHLQ